MGVTPFLAGRKGLTHVQMMLFLALKHSKAWESQHLELFMTFLAYD